MEITQTEHLYLIHQRIVMARSALGEFEQIIRKNGPSMLGMETVVEELSRIEYLINEYHRCYDEQT